MAPFQKIEIINSDPTVTPKELEKSKEPKNSGNN